MGIAVALTLLGAILSLVLIVSVGVAGGQVSRLEFYGWAVPLVASGLLSRYPRVAGWVLIVSGAIALHDLLTVPIGFGLIAIGIRAQRSRRLS